MGCGDRLRLLWRGSWADQRGRSFRGTGAQWLGSLGSKTVGRWSSGAAGATMASITHRYGEDTTTTRTGGPAFYAVVDGACVVPRTPAFCCNEVDLCC